MLALGLESTYGFVFFGILFGLSFYWGDGLSFVVFSRYFWGFSLFLYRYFFKVGRFRVLFICCYSFFENVLGFRGFCFFLFSNFSFFNCSCYLREVWRCYVGVGFIGVRLFLLETEGYLNFLGLRVRDGWIVKV